MASLRIRSSSLACALVIACGPESGSTSSSSSSDGGEGSSTSTSGADSSGSGSSGSPPGECSDYMGRATPEQTAMTPLADAEAELLAIEASGEIVAPLALYDRIVTELAAIRSDQPGLVEIMAMPSWSPSSLLIGLDVEGLEAWNAGTYDGWDCPNELYHVTEIEPSPSLGLFILSFAGLYDVNQVGEDYLAAENVSYVEPDGLIGDGRDVCLSIDGDVHTYIFDDARGDCPAGCTSHVYTGFTVDLDGTITALGSFDPSEPVPVPAWFDAAESCTTWL